MRAWDVFTLYKNWEANELNRRAKDIKLAFIVDKWESTNEEYNKKYCNVKYAGQSCL